MMIHLLTIAFVFYIFKELTVAAKKGDLDKVKEALANKANINTTEYPYYSGGPHTPLIHSCIGNHLEIAIYLVIKVGANLYFPYNQLSTQRFATIRSPTKEYMLKILKYPKMLNKIYENRYTPLCGAINGSHIGKVKELIELGADVCRKDGNGKMPIIYAVEKDNLAAINLLISNGALLCAPSALNLAVNLKRRHIIKLLIDSKTDLINNIMDDGNFLLMGQIAQADEEMVKYLIDKGAKVQIANSIKQTPLELALQFHLLDTATILKSKGAVVPYELNINTLNSLAKDGSIDVYRFLLKHNWNKNQINGGRKTTLALTCAKRHLRLSVFLIENGADINQARVDIDSFRQNDIDFDHFMKGFLLDNTLQNQLGFKQNGQE